MYKYRYSYLGAIYAESLKLPLILAAGILLLKWNTDVKTSFVGSQNFILGQLMLDGFFFEINKWTYILISAYCVNFIFFYILFM